MTAVLPSVLAYPGPDAADLIPGGWVKRASVSPARLPRIDWDQRPCPTNGHLDARVLGVRRRLTCTAHFGGYCVSASGVFAPASTEEVFA